MNKLPTDQEIDIFFAELFVKYPAKNKYPEPPQPSQKLLDLAWEASKAHRLYLIQNGLAFSQSIIPLAASDSDSKKAATTFKYTMPESIGGDWSLSLQDIPLEPEWQYLRFKCHQNLIETIFEAREVEVHIGDKSYPLGKISKRGIAETKVPKGLDLHQEIEVSFSAY